MLQFRCHAQQFTLRWADRQTSPYREIFRQQWNFNPRNSTMEVEDYKVDLHHVLTLGPDLGKKQCSHRNAPASG
jgi:hypothetical protein